MLYILYLAEQLQVTRVRLERARLEAAEAREARARLLEEIMPYPRTPSPDHVASAPDG
ncbi:hypothetical protein HNR42_000256 [Deinobacterium chartae]|uniref:Uncharacterized protein n=1 Tax=Deinobacterium chartae TaxID=521158 RepID=A0A841HW03_9DEIO|nr:hypothetical protein [Deinobacterium chartae]MBB6096844.1 hypothetical protein [Deinobacterium chartae]